MADSIRDLPLPMLWGAAVSAPLALLGVALGAIDRGGALAGFLIGSWVWGVAGWRGFLVLALFALLGSAATRCGYSRKAALGLAQPRGGRRGARQVLANTLVAGLLLFLALDTRFGGALTVAAVAAWATATCDTVASEIGQAYGSRHYLLTPPRRVVAGRPGAVSPEGTLAGAAAAALVVVVAALAGLVPVTAAPVVVAAALAGMFFESFLAGAGARRLGMDQDLLNLTNTLAGATLAGLSWSAW